MDGNSTQANLKHTANDRLKLPQSLKQQLADFRKYVWSTKLAESISAAALVVLLAYLTTYFADRYWDTPAAIRWLLFFSAIIVWSVVPFALHRWIWSNRRPDQLARLLRKREPSVGDQLLSVIELSENDTEQNRSRVLCQAAIVQVAERAQGRNLRTSAPRHFVGPLVFTVASCGLLFAGLSIAFPAAAMNAWQRFASPWKPISRFTFATIQTLPNQLVVPHGEPTPWSVQLADDSQWQPEHAQVLIGEVSTHSAHRDGQAYQFELPPQVETTPMQITVGDFYQDIFIEPKHRPELLAIDAEVTYPDYLGRSEKLKVDVRSGVLSVVEGSSAKLEATASRELESAAVLGDRIAPQGANFQSSDIKIAGDQSLLELTWRDHDGLAGRQPFQLQVKPLEDEAPSVTAQGLPRQAVILDTEQLNFTALAADDFGVKRMGISWRGADGSLVAQPAQGERVIAAGSPEQSSLQVPATFCAASLGIAPQPIEVTIYVEDYLPGREQVHSPPYLLYVLTAAEHAIWVANQMNKWQRAALDVRDTEMQLHESNKLLRLQAIQASGQDDFVRQLRQQASLEEANGRKLNALTITGTDLLKQAARNPDISVSELDQWAKMLGVLQDIGGNRMPSVADLLKQAAAQQASLGDSKKRGPTAGKNLANGSGQDDQQNPDESNQDDTKVPSVVDVESSMQTIEGKGDDSQKKPQDKKKKNQKARLSLPQTALIGPDKKPQEMEEEEEEEQTDQLADALDEQQDLLAEFEKIADELNAIMANLEGSTLVKRLKAASREQSQVAEMIASRIDKIFGRSQHVPEEERSNLALLSETEQTSSKSLSFIMDDMQAFYERRRTDEFKAVLDEMKSSDVLVSLRKLSDEIPVEHGLSIAQAEYWADTMDRWAEDLVQSDEGSKEKKEKGESKSKDSLPPKMILEMLKILEAEVNLREETRVAGQSQNAVTNEQHAKESSRLESVQREIRNRTNALADDIVQLPEADKNFEAEIKILGAVSTVMDEARALLEFGDVGSKTIAAQTEAIELLLQSRRINPKGGGGGGGSNPGTGGTGSTQDSALALIGNGINQLEKREHRDVGQATGQNVGKEFPEEFRAGLDAYFESLESNK